MLAAKHAIHALWLQYWWLGAYGMEHPKRTCEMIVMLALYPAAKTAVVTLWNGLDTLRRIEVIL